MSEQDKRQDYEKHPRYQEWFKTLQPCTACPYCGDVKEMSHGDRDSVAFHNPCCGEMHAQETYWDPVEEMVLLYDVDYEEGFKDWLKSQEGQG